MIGFEVSESIEGPAPEGNRDAQDAFRHGGRPPGRSGGTSDRQFVAFEPNRD